MIARCLIKMDSLYKGVQVEPYGPDTSEENILACNPYIYTAFDNGWEEELVVEPQEEIL
jgi:hypothetical protein